MSEQIQLKQDQRFDEDFAIGFVDIVILGVAATVFALPMLLYGPMVKGHDTYEHLNYGRHFAEQFWGGEWFPRWLLNMNHGLGTPTLFVYPPLPSYMYALLQPLGRLLHLDPFRAGEYLALLGSGVTAFLWIHTLARRRIALASAVLYMLMPYHLAADFYRRTALSECWALVWMPLVLYFASQILRNRNALLGLGMAYGLLIVSHLVSVLIFSVIPIVVIPMLAAREQRLRTAIRIAAGMALGTGLSCFYFLPALDHAKYFPPARLLSPPYYFLGTNFISGSDLTRSGGENGGFIHWVSLFALSMVAFIAICGFTVWRKGQPDSKRPAVWWMAVCVVPVFLMSNVSLPLWESTPALLNGVQYPWRFNMVLCLAGLVVGALFMSEAPRLSRTGRAAEFGLLGLIILSWLLSYGQVWKRYKVDVYAANSRDFVNEDDGWFDAWTAPGTDQVSALAASRGPRVQFSDGNGSADVKQWKARDIEFRTQSSAGGWVRIHQFYYPRWNAMAVGAVEPLEIRAALPEGVVEVKVPSGAQEVRVEIPVGIAERAGRWISFGCVLLCGMLAWRGSAPRSAARVLSSDEQSHENAAVTTA